MAFVGISFRSAFRLRSHRGPVHRLAGHTEPVPGDFVTACGLTLPVMSSVMSSERSWLTSTIDCGDCFPAR